MLPLAPAGADDLCTYKQWRWNVARKSAVQLASVAKPRSRLTAAEVDVATGCTVCREDQETVQLPGLAPFAVCKRIAARVRGALLAIQSQGVPLRQVVGYRVGLTRGALDAAGNRTGFSHHSYGIALDINPEHNGLYTDCERFGVHCRLLRGGPWRPGRDPLSLPADGSAVRALAAIGLRWGGNLAGRQKDFMHFSPGGD